MNNFSPFYLDPLGFEYFDNLLLFRLRKWLILSHPLSLQPLFPCPLKSLHFQNAWTGADCSNLKESARLLASKLQLCFPDVVFPCLPSLNHPTALIHFFASLIAGFRFYFPSLPSIHVSHPYLHTLPIILTFLLKLVILAQSRSVSPIVFLSLVPCSSVSVFVKQVSFLAQLVPRPGLPKRASARPSARVSVAEARRTSSVAWASARVKSRPAKGATAARGVATVPPAAVTTVRRSPARGTAAGQGAAVVPHAGAAQEVDATASADAETTPDATASAHAAAVQGVAAVALVAATAALCPASVVAGDVADAGACAGSGAADAAGAGELVLRMWC